MEGGAGWSRGWGWEGAREGQGGDASLNVAAVEGVALKVPIDVLHAWQLHAVLVHAPADATFAATGRLALGWGERQAVRMAVPQELCSCLVLALLLVYPAPTMGFWYAPCMGDGPGGKRSFRQSAHGSLLQPLFYVTHSRSSNLVFSIQLRDLLLLHHFYSLIRYQPRLSTSYRAGAVLSALQTLFHNPSQLRKDNRYNYHFA